MMCISKHQRELGNAALWWREGFPCTRPCVQSLVSQNHWNGVRQGYLKTAGMRRGGYSWVHDGEGKDVGWGKAVEMPTSIVLLWSSVAHWLSHLHPKASACFPKEWKPTESVPKLCQGLFQDSEFITGTLDFVKSHKRYVSFVGHHAECICQSACFNSKLGAFILSWIHFLPYVCSHFHFLLINGITHFIFTLPCDVQSESLPFNWCV